MATDNHGNHHITVLAGNQRAFVRGEGDRLTLADTVLPDTVTMPMGSGLRMAPSVNFPHGYIGCKVVVYLSRDAGVVEGMLTFVDDDWLHLDTEKETRHVRRRKITNMQVVKNDNDLITPLLPTQASYECTGIQANVTLMYVPVSKTIKRTLCVQNNTTLRGDAIIRYAERPPVVERPVGYAEERAMPAALRAAAPPAAAPTQSRINQAEYAEEIKAWNLQRGGNFFKLKDIRIEFGERWVVQCNRAPFLRFQAPFVAGDPNDEKTLFPFSGTFTINDRPGQSTALNAWQSSTHLVADMDNDGTLMVFDGILRKSDYTFRINTDRYVAMWNRSAEKQTVEIRLPLLPNESFRRDALTPEGEMAYPSLQRADPIYATMHYIKSPESEAAVREKIMAMPPLNHEDLKMRALVDPISGANNEVGVIDGEIPPHTVAVLVYEILVRTGR